MPAITHYAARRNLSFTLTGLALALALCGCNSRPVAPVLDQSELVYHNPEEGFRFEAPRGWSRHSIANYPAGRFEHETTWVKYKNLNTNRPTFFRVTFIDLPGSTTVARFLTEKSPGPEQWTMLGEAEKTTIDGVPATRYRFTGHWGPDSMAREVVAVHRGPRVIFFIGICKVDDKMSREDIRAAYKTIRWDKKS